MKAVFLLVWVLCAIAPLPAAIVTLQPSKDNTIYSSQTSRSNGGGAGLFAGTDGTGAPARSFLSFDLSGIPADATITEVKMTLTLGMVAGGGGAGTSPQNATIAMFKVSQNWGEGNAGNNTVSSGIMGSGQGFAAGPGDATWSAAAFPSTLWSNPGGDHAANASASLFLDNNITGNSFTWLSTPELVADVQGWLATPNANFGWELINANEAAARTAYIFYSRNWPSFPAGSASQVPILEVTYTVPEPHTMALLAAGAFCVPIRRRSHARKA
jgi:hypothetical protein